MKKLKYLLVVFLTMFMATMGVYAENEFVQCLNGREARCVLESNGLDMESSAITINRELTIDLQGHSFNLNHTLLIGANGKVTITSSTTEKGTIDATTIDKNAIGVNAGGSLKLDNVTVKGRTEASSDKKNYQVIFVSSESGTTKFEMTTTSEITGYNSGVGVGIDGSGKTTLDIAGTITTNAMAISTHGSIKASQDNIIINIKEGAKLTSSESAAIYAAGSSTVNITDGSVERKIGIVSMQGKIKVSGGTITATGDKDIKVGDSDTDFTGGSAIVVDNKTEGAYATNAAKAEISGGKINASDKTKSAISALIKHEDQGNDEFEITGGVFSNDISKVNDGKYISGEPNVVSLTSSGETNYYIGTSTTEVAEDAKFGDTIDVLKGSLEISNVPSGVTVENKSEGKVTVNGHDVTGETSYTVPSTSSGSHSTNSSNTNSNNKDYNVTDKVTYVPNGEDIDIKGSVVTETNDTYAKMVKLAQDRGYAKLFNMYEIHEVNNKSLTKSLTLTFNLGEENNGKYAYILHLKHDNTYEKWEQEVVNGKVSISVSELSPFIVALKDKEENKEENKNDVSNPQTSSINVIALGLISTTSLIGLITLVKKNRKNI